MRFGFATITLCCLLAIGPGCGGRKRAEGKQAPAAAATRASGSSRPAVVLDKMPGKIVKLNTVGRFVVVNFPVGSLPRIEDKLGAYRQGVRVAELRITGPQLDDNVVADVLEGQVQLGDEVRE